MLITFSCSAYADITMFGDVAVRLLRLTGHSGTVPGAIPRGARAFGSSDSGRTAIARAREVWRQR
jgi:hypothetical protein